MTICRISRMGAQGDGIADADEGPVYVPFTLPGELVRFDKEGKRAALAEILEPSPSRRKAPCRHFGLCGGCTSQHMAPEDYENWKTGKLVDALKSANIDAPVMPLVPCPPHSRRRVVFQARLEREGVIVGYYRALSHELVSVTECPIALPGIVALIPVLRELIQLIGKSAKPLRIAVTSTERGPDVEVTGTGKVDSDRMRALSGFAVAEKLARLSIEGEIVIEPRKPVVLIGEIAVTPPPGAFLQATVPAENAMGGLVGGHLAKAKKVVDLFAGCGTFALRLARNSVVHAVESDAASLAALDRAFRSATGLKTVTIERRDLERRPFKIDELDLFDGLVFDPPRAGAEAQAARIARSVIPRVVAVSCNPATLVRDLKLLIDGGYRVKSVTPIDQFLWSPHLEIVALLEKPKRRNHPFT